MSPRSATSSRALAAFSVARTRSGLAGEDALGTRFEGAALQPDETADAALGDGEERVQPGAAEGHLLGRALYLHELAAAGAQGPADEPLDLLRSAARPAVLAGRARAGRARQHGVLRGHPALALALQEGRHLVLERRRADHLGRPELDQHRALGVDQEVPRHGDGAELVGRAAVRAGHRVYRLFVTSDGARAARLRWSQLRLYSARPATMARAISSR